MTTYHTSTIPAFKAALVDALTAAAYPAEETVVVSYGEPPGGRARTCVVVGDTQITGEALQEWAALAGQGARPRNELYALALEVEVAQPGNTCRQAVEAAFEIFAVIEQRLRANPTMGVAPVDGGPGQVIVAELRQPVHTEEPTDEGYRVVVRSAVAVKARL